MSYTKPQTHIGKKPPHRAYVHFYWEGKLQRIYNGGVLGVPCYPNNQELMSDRKRELARLCSLLTDALKNGWYPGKVKEEAPVVKEVEYEPTLVERLQLVRKRFEKNGWSLTYQRDMIRLYNEFVSFLNTNYPLTKIEKIKPTQLADFLDDYRSSGRYYMNKRRNLSALYKLLGSDPNPVGATPTMRVTEELNEAYEPNELVPVLDHLKANHPNLHLCALMTYGVLLRPHIEILNLKRGDFDEHLNFITLPGKANKSGRVRKVAIPDYIRSELKERGIHLLGYSDNIFTHTIEPVNPDYFKTAWTRAKKDMLVSGIVRKMQTLYSFRHSGAIYLWNKTKDIQLIQGLMGHSGADVTWKYLRGLGIVEALDPEDLPKLPQLLKIPE